VAFFCACLERMEVFPLQLRQFTNVMPFAGIENDEQTGERRERRNPKTKHAREE
jgi:hypothetical protein